MRISRLLGNKKLDDHSANGKHLLQCSLMEKQLLEVFYKKLLKIQRKTSVPESLFSKLQASACDFL